MKIGILAMQGAFEEHRNILHKLQADTIEIRKKSDLEIPIDGLILPGGESTTMGKLMDDMGLMEPLRNSILSGLPVLATCAGLILLARDIADQEQTYLGTMPVSVQRNAYGRQLGSFVAHGDIKQIGDNIELRFIRAPYIQHVSDGVDVLLEVNTHIAAVQYKNQLAMSFHPELTQDTRIHQYFLRMIDR